MLSARKTFTMLGAVALVTMACEAPPGELTEDDAATLRGIFDVTVGHVMAGDWASWAAQFAEDAQLQPPNAPLVEGRAAIQAWGEAFPEIEELSFSNVQVWGEGNLAYGSSAYTLTLSGLPPDTGKQLAVFRRAESGKWEVVAVSYNSDLAAPTPEEPSSS